MINFNPSFFPYNNSYQAPVPYCCQTAASIPYTQTMPLYTAPVYTTLPYGINQANYVKLGVQITPAGNEVHIYKLLNGQNVALIKGEGCPIIKTGVKVGAFDENDGKRGISHLIEHSSYHESEKYKNIEEQIKAIGGYSNASTNFFQTEYHIILDNKNRQNLESAIDIEADMLFNPKFSKLDKEKSIVIQEAKKYEADEQNNTTNALKKNLYGLNHISAKDIMAGNSSKLGSITKEDLFEYHNKFYTPDNMTTVIISGENPDDLIKTVANKFQTAAKNRGLKPDIRPQIAPVNSFTRYDSISNDDTMGLVEIGFALPDSNNVEESVKVEALMQLIYDRSKFEVSKYDTHNGYATGMFSMPMENANEYQVFQNLKDKLKGVYTNPPDECELESIKHCMLDDFDSNFQSNEEMSNYVMAYVSSGTKSSILNERKAIENLTSADIISALKYFNINQCSMAALHPMGTTPEKLKADWEDSKTYAPTVILPKYTKNIDITPSIKMLNIEPYSSKPMYTGVLPNNSIFNAVNSKTDSCFLLWTLYAPDNRFKNHAAKYVLGEMISTPSIQNQYNQAKNNYHPGAIFELPNQFIFSVAAPSDNMKEAVSNLKSVADINFSQTAFENAKQKARLIINSEKEKAYDLYRKDRFDDGYNNNPDEILKELDALTLNDLRKYYNEILQNSYSTVNVSAPFDKKPELINDIASAANTPDFYFKPKDAAMFKSIYKEKSASNCYIKEQKSEQPEFQAIYDFKITGNPDEEMKLDLLSRVLSKRLFDDLREQKGLAYSVSALYENQGNNGRIILDLSSSCEDKDIPQIYEGFKQNVQNLLSGGITEKELNIAKSAYKREAYSLFDSQIGALMKTDAETVKPYGVYSMQNNFEMLDKITAKDIKQTANYALNRNPDYLADCSQNAINQNLEYFKTLGNIHK